MRAAARRNAAGGLCALGLCLLLTACGGSDPQPVVEDPWVREAPPEARVLAGYMTIRHDGRRALTLTAISAAEFDRVEMHETRMEGDRMSMQPVANVDLPAGRATEFQPGGLHLMLMEPERRFSAGDRITLTLEFSDGQRLPVEFEVRDARTLD